MLMSLSMACNMAMKAEVSLQEKFKSYTQRRNFNDNYRPISEKFKPAADNSAVRTNKFNEDKATRKQKLKKVTEKEVQKNPILTPNHTRATASSVNNSAADLAIAHSERAFIW